MPPTPRNPQQSPLERWRPLLRQIRYASTAVQIQYRKAITSNLSEQCYKECHIAMHLNSLQLSSHPESLFAIRNQGNSAGHTHAALVVWALRKPLLMHAFLNEHTVIKVQVDVGRL